ncbi:MAG: undecaprenyl-phosphate glucose phosphotransferase [Pseudomonadota bacterium]
MDETTPIERKAETGVASDAASPHEVVEETGLSLTGEAIDPALSGTPAPLRGANAAAFSVASLPGFVLIADALALVVSGALCHWLLIDFHAVTLEYYVFGVCFVAFASLVLLSRAQMYDVDAIMRPISRSDFLIVAVVTAFLLFLTIIVTLKVQDIFATRWLVVYGIMAVGSLIVTRLLAWRILRHLGEKGVIGRRLVVLGTGPQAEQFLKRLSTINPYFTTVDGVFASSEAPWPDDIMGVAVKGNFRAMLDYARTHRVDDIVIALPWSEEKLVAETVEALRELPINVAVSTDLIGYKLAFRPVMGAASQLPVFEVVQRPISGWSFLLKTLEDYVLASIAVLMLSPLLITVAIAIKIDSPGPIFFRQKRLGFNNRVFEIYKFRSMYHKEIPERVTKQAQKDDPRITRVGRFIRRTSIDELPQLLNVLNGTMSLVGPRPHALDHNEEYGRRIRGYFARHKVKPGITGWAQVRGLRGETVQLGKMKARVVHDVYYAENWSLLFDLRVLVMTLLVVLFQKNAY